MGGVNAVAGAGRKPKVKVTGDTDFEKSLRHRCAYLYGRDELCPIHVANNC